MAEEGPDPGLGYRKRVLSGVVVLALLIVLGGVFFAGQIKSPAQLAAETAAPPRTVLTAPVRSQRVSHTVIARGEVRPARTMDVAPQPPTTDVRPVITRVDVATGRTIHAGRALVEVAGRPVFVLEGAIPIYRELRPGLSGDDVAQLQEALEERGYSTYGDTRGLYGSSTSGAVQALYDAMGYEAVRTGDAQLRVALARLDRATAAVSAAEQAVRDARGDDGARARADLAAARTTVANAQERYAWAAERAGAVVPMSEVVFVPTLPAVALDVSARVGRELGENVLTLALGGMVVQAFINPADRSLVRTGMSASVSASEAGGLVGAQVSSISRVPVERDGALVTRLLLALRGDASRQLLGRSLQVVIASSATKKKVLVVPLSAVYSSPDGATRVRKISRDGGVEDDVVVRTGPQGDGYIEVRPVDGSLLAGDLVQVGA